VLHAGTDGLGYKFTLVLGIDTSLYTCYLCYDDLSMNMKVPLTLMKPALLLALVSNHFLEFVASTPQYDVGLDDATIANVRTNLINSANAR
jgi:hypothetical protein